MGYTFNLSKTNDLGALLAAGGTFASLYLVGDEPIKTALGLAILAGLAVVGYTGTNPA